MNKSMLIAAALAAFVTACARPELAPAPIAPIRVAVTYAEDRPDRTAIESRMGEALRDRLARLGAVRPAGAEASAGDGELWVDVKASMARGDVVKRAAGNTFVGSVAGGVDLTTQNDNQPKEILAGGVLGALVGIVAAPVTAVGVESRALYHNARLGYKPRHLVCRVTFKPASGTSSLILETKGWEIIQAMRPMSESEAKVPGALQKEEAEALAKVICERLEQVHHWPVRQSPEPVRGQP